MALRQYRIPVFYGIAQNITENRQNDGESPDACNMDTQSGRLSVAKGYVRESNIAFPAPESARRIYVWRRAEERKLLVATAGELFVLDEVAGVWKKLYDFGTNATAAQYDFLPVKIASTEYLLIANGTARMAKWDGVSETAEVFGSTEGLSDIAVNFVEFYYSRLFAAGDAQNPNRLYYSQAPGDTRSIENWTSALERSCNWPAWRLYRRRAPRATPRLRPRSRVRKDTTRSASPSDATSSSSASAWWKRIAGGPRAYPPSRSSSQAARP